MIPVTKPFLPPKEAYTSYIDRIWQRNWMTNNGPLVQELEESIKTYCNLSHFLFVNNGTIALQLALKALGVKGEVITTPFSFVATTSSIVWEHCKPVFVDICKDDYNIDPTQIEEAITPKTSAILATHVFGNPCDIEAIQQIADKYQLKVIYDSAHCFGVQYNGKSILEYGDISTISFHATKLYHTIEGGGISFSDSALEQTIRSFRNFGYQEGRLETLGINGKNSEFHAAMGLVNITFVDSILERRKTQYQYYLDQLKYSSLAFQRIVPFTDFNYAYFPIVFKSESTLLKTVAILKDQSIYPRRYFYPALNQLPYLYQQHCPIAESIASRILCLPLYHTLTQKQQDKIILLINNSLKHTSHEKGTSGMATTLKSREIQVESSK